MHLQYHPDLQHFLWTYSSSRHSHQGIDLQFGENDYNVIFKKVDEAGYKGACGLEFRPTLGGVESLKEFRRIYGENISLKA